MVGYNQRMDSNGAVSHLLTRSAVSFKKNIALIFSFLRKFLRYLNGI